jgi:hypothetical protein
MQVLTEQFGPVGIGWTYEIIDHWREDGPAGEVAAFVHIHLFINHDGTWSKPIPGTGGSKLTAMESGGLHFSDEAYKMATTDAISVAAKALGVGADVYMGQLDSKYQKPQGTAPAPRPSTGVSASPAREELNQKIRHLIYGLGHTTPEAAAKFTEEQTSFRSSKDGKTVPGKDHYTKLSDKAAEIFLKTLERMAKEDSPFPASCATCGLDDGKHDKDCSENPF